MAIQIQLAGGVDVMTAFKDHRDTAIYEDATDILTKFYGADVPGGISHALAPQDQPPLQGGQQVVPPQNQPLQWGQSDVPMQAQTPQWGQGQHVMPQTQAPRWGQQGPDRV